MRLGYKPFMMPDVPYVWPQEPSCKPVVPFMHAGSAVSTYRRCRSFMPAEPFIHAGDAVRHAADS